MQRLHEFLRRAVLPLSLIAALLVVTASNTVTAAPNLQDDEPIVARVAMTAPDNLDPSQLSRFDTHTRDIVENLFVGLTRFDPATQSIEPMLAKNWSVSDDGLTWTFELRDDIYWVRYDSTTNQAEAVRPVAAGDMVYAIQRACDPLRPSPVTTNLMAITGCHTVSNAFPEVVNDLFIAREIGARATSPTTLEIDLLFPISYFPTLLSTPELRPLPREALSITQQFGRSDTIMTNGPFMLTNWTDSGITLARSPQWPDAFSGNIDQIEIAFTNETTSALTLADQGQIDAARLSAEQIPAAQADLVTVTLGDSALMIGFSYERAVVSQPDARRALALAIDREALANMYFNGTMLAAEQFTQPNVVAAPQPTYALFDAAQARAALEQAGYAECTNIPETLILLVPDDDPVWEELGNAIIQQWTTVLGCNAALFEIKPVSRTLLIELSHENYDPEQVTRSHMWLFNWSADYPDAHAWINDALHCRYGYIRNERECEQADSLLDNASLTYDETERATTYTTVEDLFFGSNGSYPVAPLFVESAGWLQQPWLTGVNTTGAARYDLWVLNTDA